MQMAGRQLMWRFQPCAGPPTIGAQPCGFRKRWPYVFTEVEQEEIRAQLVAIVYPTIDDIILIALRRAEVEAKPWHDRRKSKRV